MSFREKIYRISVVAGLSWHLDYSIGFVSINCSGTITMVQVKIEIVSRELARELEMMIAS